MTRFRIRGSRIANTCKDIAHRARDQHPPTEAFYTGAFIISKDEKLIEDFYSELRAWLSAKGHDITDIY